MTTLERELLIHYDHEIVQRICQKYGFPPMKALEVFIHSQTYAMLRDPELHMTEFSPAGIFDMWEVEQVTGDPRNSLYLRRDEIDS
ncbi:hypothetical protein [Bifidobacterium saguinibicoloris]|uniref:hypothetical protein n=1 Tax=Bifidobacterium saguinibicoloris TaxID=2834433 RepID=UPI001C56484B|nr:hypothetical protein [Bifidobacterium saguinibicoloris]MBW3080714.1 hypothetical protein [Bifidobacterium saguinibicoloris]